MRNEDLRGLFYIVKGNYKNIEPKVECEDGVERCLGGYDPEGNSEEWYRVLDNEVYFCSYAGSDYDKALEVLEGQIVTFKSRKRYFKWVSEHTSEDYYFTHYLGQTPFTFEQHQSRCEGRMPRVSFKQKTLENAIYNMYGHYFDDDIAIREDSAYEVIEQKEKTKKARKVKLIPSAKVETRTALDVMQAPDSIPKKSPSKIRLKKAVFKPRLSIS